MKSNFKKLLLAVLSLVLAFSCLSIIVSADVSNNQNTAKADNKINVWLVAGQSNAVGYGETANYPDGYSDGELLNAGIENVLFYGKGYGNDVTSFAPVTFGLGKNSTYTGPEIGIATALKDSGEKHVVIKYASGDTQISATKVTSSNNISTWTPPSYVAANPGITFEGDKIGDLYDGFIATVNEAVTNLKAQGYTPVVQGFWWMQGERDSNHSSMTADLYSELLKILISDVRRDVGMITGEDLSAMPVVFGRVYCNPAHAPASEVGLAAVQAAQDMVADDKALVNVAMLDTRYDLVDPDSGEAKELVQQDKWHYDALTQQMIGEAFVKTVNTLTAADKLNIPGYGIIPELYADATSYPIVIFQNGEFKTAFGKDEFHKALEYPRTSLGLMNEANPAPAKILLRGDASLTTKDENLGQTAGVLDINLNGFTLTNAQSSYLFNGIAKTMNNFAQKFTLNVYDGNIVLGGQFLYIAAQNGGSTTGPLKDMEINFTNLNISLEKPLGANSWFVVSGSGNVSGTNDTLAEYDVRMNDCVLDFTQLKKSSQIFQLTAAYTDINFEINGGKLIAGQGDGSGTHPWRAKLYALGSANSAITFNKGSDGKYLTLVAHTDINTYISAGKTTIIDKTEFYTRNGEKAEFVKFATSAEWETYTLETDEHTEGYGTIPKLNANSDMYPIVLFQNGEFKGAYTKTQFATALTAAKDLVTTAGAPAARILLRGDAEFAGTSSANNLGFALSEIDINLGGYSLTHTDGNFVFYLRTKAHTADGETFTFNIRNGNLIIAGNGVLFAVGAQASTEEVKLTNVDINMTNVKVLYKNTGFNSGPIFTNQGGDNSSKDKEIKYTLTMNDCVLDFSNMGKANTIFDTTSKHVDITDAGVVNKIHAFDIKINGGELIVGKGNNNGTAPYASALYTLNDYSSISFGQGSDGKYLKITVPTDVTASIVNKKITVDTGVECVFVKASVGAGTTTYALYPEVMVGYKIKTSVTLYSNFVYNLYMPKANVDSFTVNGKTAEYEEVEIDGVTYYHVAVNFAAAESLSDIKLAVNLNAGSTTVTANWTLNVFSYTKSVINGNYDETTKTLMKDMLVYASAAHTYFGNTAAVADKLSEIKTLLGEYGATLPTGEAKKPADNTYFTEVAVYLGEVPSFRFYLASGYTADDFTFKVGGRSVTATLGNDNDDMGDYLEVTMYAYMMLDDVTYTVKGTDVTDTYNLYSYYNYVSTLGEGYENLVAIVEGLMKYSARAKAYRDSVVKK